MIALFKVSKNVLVVVKSHDIFGIKARFEIAQIACRR